MAGTLAGIFQMLPVILSSIQILIYIVAILFFGSIAVWGYRGFLTRMKRLLLRLVLGAICVVTGVAIAPLVGLGNPLFKLLQLDSFVGMFISSIVLLVALKLMTLSVPYSTVLKERIKRLQEKLEKRKDKDAKAPEDRLRHPATVAGLVLLIGFLGFSLLNFHGFPDMKQSIFSTLGISESDMNKINDALNQFVNSPFANLSSNCMSALEEMQGKNIQETVFTDAATKAILEQGANESVSEMYRLESGGKVLINAAMESGRHCFATPYEFCICT
jgi:hypothetical protein